MFGKICNNNHKLCVTCVNKLAETALETQESKCVLCRTENMKYIFNIARGDVKEFRACEIKHLLDTYIELEFDSFTDSEMEDIVRLSKLIDNIVLRISEFNMPIYNEILNKRGKIEQAMIIEEKLDIDTGFVYGLTCTLVDEIGYLHDRI